MSGYSDDFTVHRGILEPAVRFIQKPFSMVIHAEDTRRWRDEFGLNGIRGSAGS